VRLLGPIQVVTAQAQELDVPSATQRRLLGILGIHHGRTVRSETLAELLGVTVGALRQSVARLRTLIGPEAIHTDPTGYRLVLDTDASQFVAKVPARHPAKKRNRPTRPTWALRCGAGPWQSDALEEFCFESWAQGEATRFNELRSHSRSDRIELLIELSRFAEAIADSHAQIASNRCWIDRMDC
jgi:DNA-binding SARP family transcriptional activator